MNTKKVIELASVHLEGLTGDVFDLLTMTKPTSIQAAINLTKIVSKLSPIIGNLIEFNIVEFLNNYDELKEFGKWKRPWVSRYYLRRKYISNSWI